MIWPMSDHDSFLLNGQCCCQPGSAHAKSIAAGLVSAASDPADHADEANEARVLMILTSSILSSPHFETELSGFFCAGIRLNERTNEHLDSSVNPPEASFACLSAFGLHFRLEQSGFLAGRRRWLAAGEL